MLRHAVHLLITPRVVVSVANLNFYAFYAKVSITFSSHKYFLFFKK